MIHFNFVEFKNFLATGNAPVRVELNNENMTLIRGGNGAGKTTVLEAINYGLFGKTLRKGVTLAQLVNSVNKKKMVVIINMTIRGKMYEVHRGQKPGLFKIYEDGEQLHEDAATKELQASLENDILGVNFKIFNQVVVVASTGYTNFMELDAAKRREVVEKMLDIEVVGHMSTALKERLKAVKLNDSKLDRDVSELQLKLDNVARLIEQSKNLKGAEVERIRDMITNTELEIVELKSQLGVHKKEYDDAVASMPSVNLDEERARYAEASAKRDELQQKENELNYTIRDNNSIVEKNKKVIDFYTNRDHCEVCGQMIDSSFKDELIQNAKAEGSKAHSEIVSSKALIDAAAEERKAMDTIMQSVNDLADKLTNWKQSCDAIIAKANQVNSVIASKQQMLQRLEADKANAQGSTKDDEQKLLDERYELNGALNALVKSRADISEELELCNMCAVLLKDNGLKAKIVKQYLPLINQTINYYLECMGANYSFVLDEEFNETIKSRYRDNFSYGSFSNGQRFRIDMAILFMWRKLAESKNTVSSNLFFIDEVLDGSLDKVGIDYVFDIFATMSKSNLFVISHRKEIADRFDQVIDVNLNGNFSEYVVNGE